MKISEAKAKVLHQILEDFGIMPPTYQMIKKRGWLYIQWQEKVLYYRLFIRRSTGIDEKTKEWVRQETYEINTSDGEKIELANWKDVCSHLRGWLEKGPV